MNGLLLTLKLDEPIFIDGIKLTFRKRVNSNSIRIQIEDPQKRVVERKGYKAETGLDVHPSLSAMDMGGKK